MTQHHIAPRSISALDPLGYTPAQQRILLNLADLLLLQERISPKMRSSYNTVHFWLHAQLAARVEELIAEQALRCEGERLEREFALLVAGWPQSQGGDICWSSEQLVEATATTLAGIVGKRAG
jgi:hypothetical protein